MAGGESFAFGFVVCFDFDVDFHLTNDGSGSVIGLGDIGANLCDVGGGECFEDDAVGFNEV